MTTAVLICDDSSMARKQMARTLADGWDVALSFASNGVEALAAIKEGKGDVLFLDLNMPVMDGYETLQAINREDLPTMVIVVSGDIQPDAQQRASKLGALAFIRKPVVKEEVFEILSQYGIVSEAGAVAIAAPEASGSVGIMDCYQEVANVAMGQAADLLARLLGVFVVLPVPNVNLLEPSELQMALAQTTEEASVSAVSQGFIGGGIAGEALLLFHDSNFEQIARLMHYEGEVDDAMERELVMDVASILIGACVKGLAAQLDVSFSQGHPVILGQHVNMAHLVDGKACSWSKTLAIEISYTLEDVDISFDLLLLIAEDSLPTVDGKLAFMLE
ncbi:MAG: response regulator [Proteobacteria bacterium]|nr:MAG: response regulator [Pseudomonadota bacterium]